jgi:hypothetical protein
MNPWPVILGLVGVLLELAGVAIAAVGILGRVRSFGQPGQHAYDGLVERGRRLRDSGAIRVASVAQRIGRMLGRPGKDVRVVVGTAHLTLHGSHARVRGRAGYGRLPRALDTVGSVKELDRRTQELANRIADVRDYAEDHLEKVNAELTALDGRLGAEAADLRKQVRDVAVGDIGLQMGGLVLIGLGIGVQCVGLLVSVVWPT